jgi:uncharacterized tellurite resistance protein B-like protein
MKIKGFTDIQSQALMDLLILGMYADHNLASAEDSCVQRFLDRFQFQSDYDRQRFSDAAFTRVSRNTGSLEAIRANAIELAKNFTAADARRSAYDMLDDLLTSDGRVTSEESKLLAVVKEAFQL